MRTFRIRVFSLVRFRNSAKFANGSLDKEPFFTRHREHTKRTGKILSFLYGRGDGIRTHGLLVPNRVDTVAFLRPPLRAVALFSPYLLFPKNLQFSGTPLCAWFVPKRRVLITESIQKGQEKSCPFCMVEETGFEPTASWSRTKRATKLRYSSLFVCYFSTAIIFLQLFSSFIINDNVVLSETSDLRQRLFNKSVKLREAHHSVFVVGNNYLVHASVLMRRQFFTSRDYVFCIETRS